MSLVRSHTEEKYLRVLQSVLTDNATSNCTTKPPSFRPTLLNFNSLFGVHLRDKWAPVSTKWGVFRLRMNERPPVWRVAANILHNPSRRADKVWSSSLGVGRGANNSSCKTLTLLRTLNTCLGPGLTLWYDINKEKWTWDLVRGIRWIFRKWDVRVLTGSSRLRIGKGGRHFWLR